MTPVEKLKTKLAELFQLDQADLDFGIYRIMNAKRDEITRFMDRDLLPQVEEAFTQYKSSDRVEIQKELDKVIDGVKAAGMDPEQAPRVKELRVRYAEEAVDMIALQNEVFSHLYDFFARYYDEGDFISLRRYKEGVYAIPYEGEEVKLHWANHDQYYIKTAENFRDYAFRLSDGRRVHFKIAEADTEKDNVKASNGKDRRFILAAENQVSEENSELLIRFEYRPDADKRKQDALNADAVQAVMAAESAAAWTQSLSAKWRRADGTTSEQTVLEKRLSDYTKRNTFDYFIHKDLGRFLRRELDFYIKNEVMHLDDVENESAPRVEQYLSKIRIIRKIAHKLIAFLAQIEDFQKRLWLKKKFVVETNYCVTLDRVPEELYPEIARNDAQREEWVRLFAIDGIKADLAGQVAYSNPLTAEFLKANQNLLMDTKFFDRRFKDGLISGFEDIDASMDGCIVHSDNFQALSLLKGRWQESVDFVYIDPPYNTDATPILYKNDYKESSWLTLLHSRLALTRLLQSRESTLCVAIDDTELDRLSLLLRQVYASHDLFRVIVNHYPGSGTGRSNVTRTHEYALFVLPNGLDLLRGEVVASGERERNFRRSGTGENNYRTGRPNSFYAVLVNPKTREVVGVEPPPVGPSYQKDATSNGLTRIYPIGEDGSERVWTLSYEGAGEAIAAGLLRCTDNMVINRMYTDKDRRDLLPSVWIETKFSAVSHGNNLLTDLFGANNTFSYPKSVHTVRFAIEAGTFDRPSASVLDYFGGSGTTAHAVINLNRDDNGRRKYILVEMGDHFDTVLKPRIQKVVYSKDWKDGKPVSRDTGLSHMFKYIRLESYEDALANLRMSRTDPQQQLLDKSDAFRESYMLRYMLDVEAKGSPSLLDLDRFDDPFSYQILVGAGSVGETKPVNVDLVETFNWLLGLKVKHMDAFDGFRVVEGANPKGEKVLVIWRKIRDLAEQDPKKIEKQRLQANEALDAFFKKQQYNTMDMEFDVVYVNGDNNLMNLPMLPEGEGREPRYKVRLIEEEFKRLMFDVKDV